MSIDKRPRKVRRASEFDVKSLVPMLHHPLIPLSTFSWTMDDIRRARDLQMIGQFALPARLAEAMRTDGPLFTAYKDRLAPLRCMGVRLKPSRAAGGNYVAKDLAGLFGSKGVGVTKAAIADIHGCYANHGVAFGYNVVTPTADGRRWEFSHHYWPIEFVWWSSAHNCFMTRVQTSPGTITMLPGGVSLEDPYGSASCGGSSIVPIIHGDGRWTIYQSHEYKPFAQDAALLPGSLIWGIHAHAYRDWAKGSSSHGNAKVVGELPEGVPLMDADGVSPEAASFLELVQAIASMDTPAGIRAFGTKLEYIMNTSSAWQVWDTLAQRAERLAFRIYLGTDGALGAGGGAPGVDLEKLFNVATTIAEGDTDTIEYGFQTGCIDPCCAVNYGSSELAPSREYIRPDSDSEAVQASYAERDAKFQAAVKAAKENGFVVDQPFVNAMAERYGVEPPSLAVSAPSGADFYAYELEGGIVTIDEVRARKGLSPLPNGQGTMTVPQARALAQSANQATPQAPPTESTDTAPVENIADEPTDIEALSENDEPPAPSNAAELASQMTELAIERCEHNCRNRCRICGIERKREVSKDDDGNAVWAIKWIPID